jgi:hypothetical protein
MPRAPKIRQRIIFALICASLLATSGCLLFWVGAGAGAATAVYLKGELRTTEHVPLDQAWQATLRAMTSLGIPITERAKDALSASLQGRTGDQKDVTVTLVSKAHHWTEIRIRVGTLGDEARSRRILETIRSQY